MGARRLSIKLAILGRDDVLGVEVDAPPATPDDDVVGVSILLTSSSSCLLDGPPSKMSPFCSSLLKENKSLYVCVCRAPARGRNLSTLRRCKKPPPSHP